MSSGALGEVIHLARTVVEPDLGPDLGQARQPAEQASYGQASTTGMETGMDRQGTQAADSAIRCNSGIPRNARNNASSVVGWRQLRDVTRRNFKAGCLLRSPCDRECERRTCSTRRLNTRLPTRASRLEPRAVRSPKMTRVSRSPYRHRALLPWQQHRLRARVTGSAR